MKINPTKKPEDDFKPHKSKKCMCTWLGDNEHFLNPADKLVHLYCFSLKYYKKVSLETEVMNTSFGTCFVVLKYLSALAWNRAHRPKPRHKTHTSRANPIELPLLDFSISLRSETKDHLGSIVDLAKPEKNS